MSDLIPAVSGWRYVYWENENDGPMALPIVAWERGTDDSRCLTPFVLSYCGSQVAKPLDSDWFVAIIPPDDEFADYIEAAADVAKAQRAAEDREYAERRKATP